MNSSPSLPTENQNHVSESSTSRNPKRTGMRICRVLCGDVCSRLGEVACTSKEKRNELQESERDWVKLSAHPKRIEMRPRVSRSEPEGRKFWSFSSPNFSTHFFLLILKEWVWKSEAESWRSRGTCTWGSRQFCAREANVLSEHRV